MSIADVLSFVRENDVKFIRLAFCDLSGVQKNISIMPQELPAALSDGISFDASAVSGFSGASDTDLFLHPDPSTLALLPWRPQHGRVARFYCDILRPDGEPFERDPRAMLRKAAERFAETGYELKAGAECEFYLFKTEEDGRVSETPFDEGGYLDVSPLDRGENIRREICLDLERMGIQPESSHHGQGPGQNEISFKSSDALNCADNLTTFKTAVKTIAARNGLFASFMPKPIRDKNGSGMRVNISLFRAGKNVSCVDEKDFESFAAGVLEKIPEMTAFLNPDVNSYDRLKECGNCGTAFWSMEDRAASVRIPAAKGDKMRMELRSADSAANPYIALALVINAGLYGIKNGLKLPTAAAPTAIPSGLEEAVNAARVSELARETLGDSAFEKYIELVNTGSRLADADK